MDSRRRHVLALRARSLRLCCLYLGIAVLPLVRRLHTCSAGNGSHTERRWASHSHRADLIQGLWPASSARRISQSICRGWLSECGRVFNSDGEIFNTLSYSIRVHSGTPAYVPGTPRDGKTPV